MLLWILVEGVATSNMTLSQVVIRTFDAVQARAEKGNHHDVIILLEDLIKNSGYSTSLTGNKGLNK
jgi:hypothetical protein